MNCERQILYFLDGRAPNSRDLELLMSNSAFMWGMSAFTTARICEGALGFCAAHRERLVSSANWLWQGEFSDLVEHQWEEGLKLLTSQLLGQGLWRFRFTLFQDSSHEIHCLMALNPLRETSTSTHKAELNLLLREDPIHYKDRPNSPKLGSYLDRFRVQNGENETVLFYNADNLILETAVANILFYRESDQSFIAPFVENEMLQGIGMRYGLKGLNFIEQKVSKFDISDFDSAFLINSLRGPQPVLSLDRRKLQVREDLALLLREQFEKCSRKTQRNLWAKVKIPNI